MKIAIALCPCFTRGRMPPLGLAYLSAVLRRAGYKVLPFDFDFMLAFENKELSNEIYGHINIAHDRDNKVNFIVNPNLVFQSLFASKKEMKISLSENEMRLVRSAKYYSQKYTDIILRNNPDVVFLSTYIGNLWFSLLMAQRLKERRRGVKVVFGGPGCGLLEIQEIILRFGFVDMCVIGEGEETVVQLSKSLEKGEEINGIRGISLIKDDAVSYLPRPPIKNLNTLPYPDFDDFPFPGANIRQYYLIQSTKGGRRRSWLSAIPISASRGCVVRCAFCSESAYWKIFRHREIDSLICEIKHQQKKYDANLFAFCDSLLNFSPIWIEQFCNAILKEKIKVKFVFSYFRIKKLPLKLLKKLAKAGFCFIDYGVENGSQSILKLMRKATDINEMKKILVDTSRCGILWHSAVLVGFPSEKRKDIVNTIKFMVDIENSILKKKEDADYLPFWFCTPVRLEPYSFMYNSPKKFRIKLTPYKIQIPLRIKHLEPYIAKILVSWRSRSDVKELDLRMRLIKRYTPPFDYKPSHRSHLYETLVDCIVDSSKFTLSPPFRLRVIKNDKCVLEKDGTVILTSENDILDIFFILRKLQMGFSIKELCRELRKRYEGSFQSMRAIVIKLTVKLLLDNIIQFDLSPDMLAKTTNLRKH